jgi:glucuronate isomerase
MTDGKTLSEDSNSKGVSNEELLRLISPGNEISPRATSLLDRIRNLPIIDFHTHYDVQTLIHNLPWKYPSEIFLGRINPISGRPSGFDHYLAQLLLHYNVPENIVFGTIDSNEKAEKVRFSNLIDVIKKSYGSDKCLWFLLSLQEVFHIDVNLFKDSSDTIWRLLTDRLQQDEYTPLSLLIKAKVTSAFTTDDPIDDLSEHRELKSIILQPTWRPDAALMLTTSGRYDFKKWIMRLGECSGIGEITSVEVLFDALTKRLCYFIDHGCTTSDLGFVNFYPVTIDGAGANALLRKYLAGGEISSEEFQLWHGYIFNELIALHLKHGLRQLLHQGVLRDCNTARFTLFGADIGGDVQGERIHRENFVRFFQNLSCYNRNTNETTSRLTSAIIFPTNQEDAEWITVNSAPFFGYSKDIPTLQVGPPWWWNDTRHGLRETIQVLIRHHGIYNWIGMASDARCLSSVLPRFLVFRATLVSELLNTPMLRDLNDDILYEFAYRVCYQNAKEWARI